MKLPKKQNIKQTNPEDPVRRYYQPLIRHAYIKRLKIALDFLLKDRSSYSNILEIGYGSGIFFPELAQHCKQLHGLDTFGEEGKAKVRKMMEAENIDAKLTTGSVLEIPFEDNSFDAVIAISILEHLEPKELEKAISEIKRVVKKDGLIILGFPSRRKIMQIYCMLICRNLHFDFHRSDHNAILKQINQTLKVEKMKKFFKFLPIYYAVKCKK